MKTSIIDSKRGTYRYLRTRNGQVEIDQWVQTQASTPFTRRGPFTKNPRQFDGYRRPSDYTCVTDDMAFLTKVHGGWYQSVSRREHTWDGTRAFHIRPSSIQNMEDAKAYKNELRTRLLNNLKDEVLDVTMVLGEALETASMVGDNLVRVARGMDMIRNRKPESFYYLMTGKRMKDKRPTEKFLAEVSSDYLEWKYGVMPTLLDIQGACKALDMNEDGSFFDNPPLMVARARITDTRQKRANVYVAVDHGTIPVDVTATTEVKARTDYSVNGEALRGLSRYGVGLTSPATLVFERTPYAFLLNMVIPIADTIKAWGALSGGVTVRGHTETYLTAYEIKSGFATTKNNSYPGDMHWSWDDHRKCISYIREGYSTVPMPLPYVRNPLRTGNVATALSLFTQMWTSIKT